MHILAAICKMADQRMVVFSLPFIPKVRNNGIQDQIFNLTFQDGNTIIAK
jgi:hypothetical protein